MTILPLPDTELAFSTALAAFGALWTVFKTAELLTHLRDRRVRRALLVLQAAVDETFRTYVQSIKEGRSDGKLTVEERRRARELAKARAYAIARREGVDLARDLGGAFLDVLIARTVKRLKRQ